MTDITGLVSALRASSSSPVHARGDEGFAEALTGFGLTITNDPDAVVVAADAASVSEAVRLAAAAGVPVRTLATGHGSHRAIADGLVVSTRALTELSLDPRTRIATIGGGVAWGAVVALGAPHGLAPITGSSPTVGATGYLLGGGVGPLARSHGFSSDWVRGFTVVTATGDIVTASAEQNPHLFWALRGGKGGLGIVVETRLELAPLPELFAGNIMFDAASIGPVLRAWVDFTRTAPADVTTSVAIMRMPPFETIPEPIRGATLISLRFARPGDAETGASLVAPLLAAGTPVLGGIAPLAIANVAAIHADPTEPSPAITAGGLLESLDQHFATALLEVAGADRELPVVSIELRHIGSATRTDVAQGSAVGGRSSDYTLNLVGMAPVPAVAAQTRAGFASVLEAIAPWMSANTTINFATPTTRADFAAAWPTEIFERLAAVRSQWDPNGVFPYIPAE